MIEALLKILSTILAAIAVGTFFIWITVRPVRPPQKETLT